MSEELDLPPPPAVGEPIPRGAQATGVRHKLATYSLDMAHKDGGPKALGFELILGIAIDAIDYLEAQIMAGILRNPIGEIRDNAPYGVNCVVDVPVPGIGAKAGRLVEVRTIWEIKDAATPPRLITAYPKP
jgi:hypothetical protein